ncbi:MAG TPA: dephospho-CoA kinase [Stellaceae bacterium]|nr:dephospho-CoA kinase [Stellaceae bacterium]
MKVLGLTGSVGMGKSAAAAMLRRMGVSVHDADREVHDLLAPGGAALKEVTAAFPGVVRNGVLDRRALGRIVFADPRALARLEAILHPKVRARERRFMRRMRARRAPLVALDIPLLYETGGDRRCDRVAVMWAPNFIQRARVMRRPGMNAARFAAILAKQLPDRVKRIRADFTVPSGLGRAATWRRLRRVLDAMRSCPAESDAAE